MNDPYKQLVNDIIADLENGVRPWTRPWTDDLRTVVIGAMEYSPNMWPSNVRAPAVPFGMFNGMQLLRAAMQKQFRTNFWLTEKVFKELGVAPDGDQKPTEIVAYFSDSSRVYNIDQIKDCEKSLGLTIKDASPEPGFEHKKSESQLKKLRNKDKLLLITEGKEAAYFPKSDLIKMPDIRQFTGKNKETGEAHYWATLWHEVIHWTGHPDRLGRDQNTDPSSDAYAFEELIAEMGAAFLCMHLGVKGDLQHSAYIGSWIKRLRSDSAFLYKAAEHADKARSFVIKENKPKKEDATAPDDDSEEL